VGTLVGRQVPAVIGSMLWLFIVEPLSNLIGDISKFTIGQTETVVSGDRGGDLLPLGAAVLVLAGWAALLALAGALADRRRDIA
ncbi:MAG TPA: hypothetical protein VH025_03980, partial [Solirubrobacteraceae bacterium]|nr:hypothetical protein [Solirubrobacteraceae bacterium]